MAKDLTPEQIARISSIKYFTQGGTDLGRASVANSLLILGEGDLAQKVYDELLQHRLAYGNELTNPALWPTMISDITQGKYTARFHTHLPFDELNQFAFPQEEINEQEAVKKIRKFYPWLNFDENRIREIISSVANGEIIVEPAKVPLLSVRRTFPSIHLTRGRECLYGLNPSAVEAGRLDSEKGLLIENGVVVKMPYRNLDITGFLEVYRN